MVHSTERTCLLVVMGVGGDIGEGKDRVKSGKKDGSGEIRIFFAASKVVVERSLYFEKIIHVAIITELFSQSKGFFLLPLHLLQKIF